MAIFANDHDVMFVLIKLETKTLSTRLQFFHCKSHVHLDLWCIGLGFSSSLIIPHALLNLQWSSLYFSYVASRELFLLVQNDGEGILKVNLTITDIKVTFPEIQLSKHDAKKVQLV